MKSNSTASWYLWLTSFVALLAVMLAFFFTVVGCAPLVSTTPAPTASMPSQGTLAGITLSVTAATSIGLDIGITDATKRMAIGNDLYTISGLVNQLALGKATAPGDLSAYLLSNGVKNSPEYPTLVALATSAYASIVYPRIQANPTASSIDAYIVAFTTGLQNATAAYAPKTILTSWNDDGKGLPARFRVTLGLRCPNGESKDAYDVSLAGRHIPHLWELAKD